MAEDQISNLKERVTKLETYFKISVGFALAIGISGSLLLSFLKSTQAEIERIEQNSQKISEEIEGLQDRVSTAQSDLDSVTGVLEKAIQTHLAEMKEAEATHLANISSMVEKAASELRKHTSSLSMSLSASVENEIRNYSATTENRLSSIENQLLQNEVLAVITVKGTSMLVQKTTEGVQYDSQSGVVTFSNDDNSEYFVIVGNYGADNDDLRYRTDTNFFRTYLSPTQFQVWKTALDTGGRNSPPKGFTAIVMRVGS